MEFEYSHTFCGGDQEALGKGFFLHPCVDIIFLSLLFVLCLCFSATLTSSFKLWLN